MPDLTPYPFTPPLAALAAAYAGWRAANLVGFPLRPDGLPRPADDLVQKLADRAATDWTPAVMQVPFEAAMVAVGRGRHAWRRGWQIHEWIALGADGATYTRFAHGLAVQAITPRLWGDYADEGVRDWCHADPRMHAAVRLHRDGDPAGGQPAPAPTEGDIWTSREPDGIAAIGRDIAAMRAELGALTAAVESFAAAICTLSNTQTASWSPRT